MRDVIVGYVDRLGYLRCRACAPRAATPQWPFESQTPVYGRIWTDGDQATVVLYLLPKGHVCDCCRTPIAPTFEQWRASREEPTHEEEEAVRRLVGGNVYGGGA